MRRPVWAVHVFVVGLALHNFVMAELWDAGIHGRWLDVISSWKEALLVLCLVAVWSQGWRTFRPKIHDLLALAYAAVVVVWSILPQHWLGGHATHRGIVLGARHDLVPVGAYLLGRGLALTGPELRRIGATILGTAAGLAVFGLVDIYAIPLSWWRHSGAPGWFSSQLGFHYFGLSNLPENFVYNTGNEHPLRRLVSTFLSPLASSYVFLVALLLAVAWFVRRRPSPALWMPLAALLLAGLLWTHSRSSYFALVAGLVAIALVRRGGFDLRGEVLRMWRDLALPADDPVWPDGVHVRSYEKADARRVQSLLDEAYLAWDPAYSPQPHEDWVQWMTGHDEFDPELWLLAERDGDLVACGLHWKEHQQRGWVKDLVVREDERGRGLAKALLHEAFRSYRERGATRVGLKVDATNPTGAPQLYARVGIETDRRYGTWVKQL